MLTKGENFLFFTSVAYIRILILSMQYPTGVWDTTLCTGETWDKYPVFKMHPLTKTVLGFFKFSQYR